MHCLNCFLGVSADLKKDTMFAKLHVAFLIFTAELRILREHSPQRQSVKAIYMYLRQATGYIEW